MDFAPSWLGAPLELSAEDKHVLQPRHAARKPLQKARCVVGQAPELAGEIAARHMEPKGRTLVVVNTVKRARDLFVALGRLQAGADSRGAGRKTSARKKSEDPPASLPSATRLVLLHSRFRPADRERHMQRFLDDPPQEGTICVSTQVVEAGADVSATTLFTELAPWASLVQRFGRCNRDGAADDRARVFWIDTDLLEEKNADDVARPYLPDDLREARTRLVECAKDGVGPACLPSVKLDYSHTHVLRSREVWRSTRTASCG